MKGSIVSVVLVLMCHDAVARMTLITAYMSLLLTREASVGSSVLVRGRLRGTGRVCDSSGCSLVRSWDNGTHAVKGGYTAGGLTLVHPFQPER